MTMSKKFHVPEIQHSTYIKASPKRVYDAISTGEGWNSWFTQKTTIQDGQIRLRWENFGSGKWTMEDGGPVVAAEPGKKFAFQWSPGTRPTTVTMTLKKLAQGTVLTLVESGYPSTEKDLEAVVGCATGWGEALTLLKFYLEHGVVYGKVPSEKK